MANTNVNNCASCTKRYSLSKPDDNCLTTTEEICDVRMYCKGEVTEVFSPSEDLACENGILSDMIVDPTADKVLFAIDVLNPDAIDETIEYSFDRETDIGTETYALGPLKVKLYNPDQECTINSWKGQDIAIVYKIENRDGTYKFRRVCGKLTNITGSLLAGYELTIDAVDPSGTEKPVWVSFGTGTVTEDSLDLITDFGS